MSRKDITDYQVCRAYAIWKQTGIFPDELLQEWTNQPKKICYAAIQRVESHGLIDCGVSLRSGWLTAKGLELLKGADK